MLPVLINFNFATLFPLLLIIALTLYGIAIFLKIKYQKLEDVDDKKVLLINSLKSGGNTLFLLAITVIIIFKVLLKESLPLNSYGLMMATAFIFGIIITQKMLKREALPKTILPELSAIIIITSLAGARAFFLIFEEHPTSILDIFAIWKGGLVIYGGITFAVIASIIYIKKKKLPLGKIFDAFAPSIGLGLFFGRIGCFCAGCCYGKPTDSVLGISFPASAPVYTENNIQQCSAVHPTQLYSSLSGMIIFLIIMAIYKKKKFDGEIFLIFSILYSISRFIIEIFRIDTPHNLILGQFSLSQGIGILILPVATALIIFNRIKIAKNS